MSSVQVIVAQSPSAHAARPAAKPFQVKASTTVSALDISSRPLGTKPDSPVRVTLLGAVSAPEYYKGTTAVVVQGKRYAVSFDGKKGPIGAKAIAEALAATIKQHAPRTLTVSVKLLKDAVGSNVWALDIAPHKMAPAKGGAR